MASADDYFGYTTAQNQQLIRDRQMARHMGEDIRYYPAPESGDYIEPTRNWDTDEGRTLTPGEETQAFYRDSIEKIYKRIMGQDAAVVRQLADRWYEVNQVLDDLRSRVFDAAEKLKYGSDGAPGGSGGWTGQGADAFLARGPGATLKSIDEWEQAAVTNWLGTLALAEVIERRQAEMARLWDRYTQGMVAASDRWLKSKGYDSVDDLVPGTPGADQYITHMRDSQLAWNWQAQKVQYGMAREYWSVMSEDLNGGRATVYEGPTDAVRENPQFIARHKLGSIGVPHVPPPSVTPPPRPRVDVTPRPDITPPTVDPRRTAPDLNASEITRPDVTTPDVTAPDVTAPTVTRPDLTAPTVTPPVVPPVAPSVLPRGGQLPAGAPALSPGAPPLAPGAKGLLSNLPGGGGPGVLRAAVTPPSADGLPPSVPQSPRAGQAPPPPQIKGRAPVDGTPTAPPGKRGPQDSTPATPGAVRVPGASDQFGAPPGVPSSPVLRNPRATATPPAAAGPGPRFGAPAAPGANPSVRRRADAAPPVLGRPRPSDPVTMPSPPRSAMPDDAGLLGNPLAPPQPTTSPVVGRSPRTAAGGPQPAEPSTGVLRGKRGAGSPGYEAQMASRKMAVQEPAARGVEQEFDKIRKILDQEGAWTVETPGGGVLDSAPTRPVAPSAEPRPRLGAS